MDRVLVGVIVPGEVSGTPRVDPQVPRAVEVIGSHPVEFPRSFTVVSHSVPDASVQRFGPDQHGGLARFPLDVSRPRADSFDRNVLGHWYVGDQVLALSLQIPNFDLLRKAPHGHQVGEWLLNTSHQDVVSVG